MIGDSGHLEDDNGLDPELNRISSAIIGCGIAVHRELGPGQLESAYQKAMAIEMRYRGIPFDEQQPVILMYRGEPVGEGRMDFVVEKRVVLEIKAVQEIVPVFRVQLVAYLKMTKLPLGLLMNFNVPRLVDGIRRIAN